MSRGRATVPALYLTCYVLPVLLSLFSLGGHK